jgi:hypothetical protein
VNALLVPIQVDALVVRDTNETWARTALEEPKPTKGRRKRQKLVPDPFQELDPPRPTGVYLHWALPDGLTRGRFTQGAEAAFPPVPNRWLVLRLSGATPDDPRAVAGWLLPDVNAKEPVRIDAFSGAPLPALGDTPARPLTALGPGDLAWSGYYDNVLNRFALYDDLAGITEETLAYLVCGWYTNPAHEPIAAATESAFADRVEDLGWSLDASQLTPGTGYPTASVYHGVAVSIGWPEESWPGDGGTLGNELDARPTVERIEAAVGQNLAEAMAALTTTEADSGAYERLLEGLFASALPELSQPDGAARFDTALHLALFGSRPAAAASEWVWQPGEGAAEPPPTPPAPGTPSEPASAGLHEALAASENGGAAEIPVDLGVGSFVEVRRSKPRVWHALNPAVALRGAGRSFKHGGDGRFTASGHLACRVEERTLTEFGVDGGNVGSGAAVLPANPLGSLPTGYGVPSACSRLLVEAACLDPGSAPDLASSTPTQPSPVAAARARWWTSFDPTISEDEALEGAHVVGTLPSAVAVTPPTRPWTPLHLEWSAEYLPSPRGAHDWRLGEIDYDLPSPIVRPPVDADHALEGRVMLSSAPASILSSAVRTVEGNAPIAGPAVADALGAAADAAGDGMPLADSLANQDLLAGELAGIMEQLRKDPTGAIVQEPELTTEGELSAGPRPDAFVALRAGFMRLTRVRLVDAYGQLLELVPGPVSVKPGLRMAVEGESDLFCLTPRFTARSRVLLRYAAATGARVDADPGVSPACGYLVPSPLDGTLEFFNADGVALGRLRPDPVTWTAWEEDPGQSAAVGALPSRWITNPYLAALADNLLAADTAAALAASRGEHGPDTPALASLLQAIDTTRWTVDLTGRSGDEHLALLLGQPVAVLRATLKFEIEDPRRPPENAETAIQIRMGALAHRNDGLLAYVVDDDFTRVRLVDPAVAEQAPGNGAGGAPLASPFLDTSGVFEINPGRPVPLTLLVMPGTDVHVTAGVVPRKRVGMLREWVAPALSRLSPALRYGPVLRDPAATRLPVPSDIRGTWSWHRRPDPIGWESDEVVPATADAIMGDTPALVSDGWLQVELAPDTLYRTTAIPIQIRCVRRLRGQMVAVGGTNPNGSRFLIPVAEAAALQESGRFAFFVQEPGAPRVDVRVIRTARGSRYLRTVVDSRDPNNLARLRDCPREDE